MNVIPEQLRRLQALSQDGVTVRLWIPADDETASQFGVSLAAKGIQPIWLRIENASDVDYWLLPVAIDPDYFSADEAALIAAQGRSRQGHDKLVELFRTNALPFHHPAGSTSEGYVFATYMRGGRFVDVRLTGHLHSIRQRFAVLLPTEGFDYEKSALRQRYAEVSRLPDLTVEQLRQYLRELPCCATNKDESSFADPLNFVLVGSGEDAVAALTASGWFFTEAISVDSIRKMVGAAIAGNAFLTAPVSSLYAFGRKQDVALQRGRSTISRRNHLRLWLAPHRCEGKPVWVGQVSRDIGVKITARSPTLTTHIIDPVIDESREYLFQSLLRQDAVEKFAFVRGVGAARPSEPRFNLTGDPYFTDGLRLVVWVSRVPVPPQETEDLMWNESTDPVRRPDDPMVSTPTAADSSSDASRRP